MAISKNKIGGTPKTNRVPCMYQNFVFQCIFGLKTLDAEHEHLIWEKLKPFIYLT